MKKNQIDRATRENYPSRDVLQSKTLTITEEQAYELEAMSGVLRNSGLAATQSDIVRLCLEASLEDVKMRLCKAVGLDDCPSFKSK